MAAFSVYIVRFSCDVKGTNRSVKETVVVVLVDGGRLLIVNCNSQPTRKDSYFI